MELECDYRFVLLDLGHPMNVNSIENIIDSLQNVLALVVAFPRRTREISFGISILNSDFTFFESESDLRKNYDVVIKKLTDSLKTTRTNNRVTVQGYKYLLSSSIAAVLQEFRKFVKGKNLCSQLRNPLIQIAVVTKKTTSVLADILIDVTDKLQKNFPSMPSVKRYKIVHVSAKQETVPLSSDKTLQIDWISCSDIYSLNCFFKEWFLNVHQPLKIVLSRELHLEVRCDVSDCIVNPVSVRDGRLDDIYYKNSNKHSVSGSSKSSYDLEVLHRLPTNGFCPTFVFGLPRRVSARRSSVLNWTESELNAKIFKQLCRELCHTGEGLLAKSASPTWTTGDGDVRHVTAFHLLTSDGSMLLMNDVAPEELYLPSRGDAASVRSVDSCGDETTAASLIRNCFEKIKRLDEYNPRCYQSGVYEYSKKYLVQVGQSKSLFGHFDPSVKLFGGKSAKKEISATADCSNDGPATTVGKTRKKRQKTAAEIEAGNVHPALLSENVVGKYRKIHSQAFNLPELSNSYD